MHYGRLVERQKGTFGIAQKINSIEQIGFARTVGAYYQIEVRNERMDKAWIIFKLGKLDRG
jgi:hypothetical protein